MSWRRPIVVVYRSSLFPIKKRPGISGPLELLLLRLEADLSTDLDGARGSVGAKERSEDAGGSGDGALAITKVGRAENTYRLIEVGMVQYVERLSSDLKFRALPPGNAEILHDGEVGIEKVRAVNLVAAFVSERGNASSGER